MRKSPKKPAGSKNEDYISLCVNMVCEKLKISDPVKRNFINELAHHSESDGHFFNKVKTWGGMKPEMVCDEEEDKPQKITVIMGEYNDGKDTKLPPLLETRLRELRSND